MKHEALRRRVVAAELRVATQIDTVRAGARALRADTRAAVTPLRIVTGGFLGGFAIGLAAPMSQVARLANVPKLLQLATGIVGFVNALRVQQAAEATEAAADEVGEASQRIDETL
ncbi:hypothetical protein [Chiayiivirga flava]|uniref:Uncharacterized protein n=1 Tax=Chiayiivirga flava TaxID=659595 RepID=A0A7W8G268_9GAMM|nr:hypothetical protein [Chiayiivirga flava]MBB5209633.1 hypothetical protein [Chiayiivirga flava]